jgi:hypothetical protein
MDNTTQILENVVRCKYFEADVLIKNPIKNLYQDGLDRTTQTLDHVVVVHILIWDKRKSQINEYSEFSERMGVKNPFILWDQCWSLLIHDWIQSSKVGGYKKYKHFQRKCFIESMEIISFFNSTIRDEIYEILGRIYEVGC